MLLVCLSHFAVIYSASSGVSFDGVYYFTMMAAPTFMIISGILLGFFYTNKKSSFDLIKRDYINRGFFILTIARLFICSAHTLRSHGFLESSKYVYITDAVGINIASPIMIYTWLMVNLILVIINHKVVINQTAECIVLY